MGTRRHYGPLPTAAGGRTDLEGFAKAAGYAHTTTVSDLKEFEAALHAAIATNGPSYILAKIDRKLMPDLPAKPLGTVEQAIKFRRGLVERGWISSGHAGVSQGKWLAPADRSAAIVIPEIETETEAGPRPSMEKAPRLSIRA